MSSPTSNETRDDVDAICRLKYTYLQALDTKAWEDFAACFVPEATGDYNGLEFSDRDSLVKYMSDNMGPGMLTIHQAHHPIIDVDGDTATGSWSLQDKVIMAEFKFMLEGAAFYQDRYARTPDGWRIAHTGYRRAWELHYSLDDLPSLKVEAGGKPYPRA